MAFATDVHHEINFATMTASRLRAWPWLSRRAITHRLSSHPRCGPTDKGNCAARTQRPLRVTTRTTVGRLRAMPLAQHKRARARSRLIARAPRLTTQRFPFPSPPTRSHRETVDDRVVGANTGCPCRAELPRASPCRQRHPMSKSCRGRATCSAATGPRTTPKCGNHCLHRGQDEPQCPDASFPREPLGVGDHDRFATRGRCRPRSPPAPPDFPPHEQDRSESCARMRCVTCESQGGSRGFLSRL